MKAIVTTVLFLLVNLQTFAAFPKTPPVKLKGGDGYQKGNLVKGVGLAQLNSGDYLLTTPAVGGFVLGDGNINLTSKSVWIGLYDNNFNLKYAVKVPEIKVYSISDPKWVLQQIIIEKNDEVNLFYSNNRGKTVELWRKTFNPKSQVFSEGMMVWSGEKNEIYKNDDYAKFSIRKLPSGNFKVYVLQYSSSKSGTSKRPEYGDMELSGNEIYEELPFIYNVGTTFFINEKFELDTDLTDETENGSFVRDARVCLSYNKEAGGQYSYKVFDYDANKVILKRKSGFKLSSPNIIDYPNSDYIIIVAFASKGDVKSDQIITYKFSKKSHSLLDSVVYNMADYSKEFTDQTNTLIDNFKNEVRNDGKTRFSYHVEFRDNNLLISCIYHGNAQLSQQFTRTNVQTGAVTTSSNFTYFQSIYGKVEFVTLINQKHKVDQGDIGINDYQYEKDAQLGGYLPFLREDGETSFYISFRNKGTNTWTDFSGSKNGTNSEATKEVIADYGQLLMHPSLQLDEHQRIVIVKKGKKMRPISITF
ncbi:hypothetical protein GC194_09370 [bacterium]|nr:hypothetical protein [bacterium]